MPQWTYRATPDGLSTEEFRRILEERRDALRKTCGEGTLQGHMPVAWRSGWSATWKNLGRDAQGNLKVLIAVYGPGHVLRRRSYVRLVKKHPLPYSLGPG